MDLLSDITLKMIKQSLLEFNNVAERPVSSQVTKYLVQCCFAQPFFSKINISSPYALHCSLM